MARALGASRAVLLRNHGVLVVGRHPVGRADRRHPGARRAHPVHRGHAGRALRSDTASDAERLAPEKYRDAFVRRVLGGLAATGGPVSGADRVTIETTVNGTAVSLEVLPSDLLLDVLRDHLGLTGAKRSCDVQVCGTCTVLRGRSAGERLHHPRPRGRGTGRC